MIKHQQCNTKAYRIWGHIKTRCRNPNNPAYKYYGGRGIDVCDAWFNSFKVFLADMGHPPDGCSIDRIDNNLGYCKENCRWADAKTQSRNRRVTIKITFNGETRLLVEWADKLGIASRTLATRFYSGMPLEKVLSPNVRKTIKLSPEQVREIVLAKGPKTVIARKFGIGRDHVMDLKAGKARRDITVPLIDELEAL